MILRLAEKNIKKDLFKGKTIILYGARQVGKTTLVQNLLNNFGGEGRYINCEIFSAAEQLKQPEPERLRAYLGNYKLIVLDEAQNLEGIGRVLKMINDTLKEIQVVATGSSSFDLANKSAEAMTGRTFEHILYPLSYREITDNGDLFRTTALTDKLLVYGSYPEVFTADNSGAERILSSLASSYLFKDLLKFEGIKKSSLLKNLLISLALQTGSEVSYHELAVKLGVNPLTVQKYIDLLEQSFVIFRLYSFSRNLRKELSKAFKVYFYDNGIRNALINNFNPPALRNDAGALWENYCIAERIKSNSYNGRRVNSYFWRTYDQKEIDLVEEAGGKITGYEFKFSSAGKRKIPADFIKAYDAEVQFIDPGNVRNFLN